MKAKILVSLIVLLAALAVAGCSPVVIAGPFVTHIGYDGEGSLVVTKNAIVLDPFMGTISNGNPQTIVIKSPRQYADESKSN